MSDLSAPNSFKALRISRPLLQKYPALRDNLFLTSEGSIYHSYFSNPEERLAVKNNRAIAVSITIVEQLLGKDGLRYRCSRKHLNIFKPSIPSSALDAASKTILHFQESQRQVDLSPLNGVSLSALLKYFTFQYVSNTGTLAPNTK